MNSIIFIIICSLLASPLWIGRTFAQDTESTTQETQNTTSVQPVEVKLGPSSDAHVTYVFPSSNNRAFFIGKPIPVVIGLSNLGNGVFNVSKIGASLMYPQDHRYFIQNFTKGSYGESVFPSEQRSFVYYFFPDPLLEPRDYGLVVTVYYTDSEGGNFTNVVYNNTIALIEADESIDAQTLFLYVGVLGVAGLVGFVVYNSARGASKRKGPKRVEYGTQATVLDNEWLAGTSAQSPRSKKVKNTRKNA